MNTRYTVRAISAAEIDQAYVLVRLVDPYIGIEEWRDFCRDPCGAGRPSAAFSRRVLIAQGPRGYVHGVCVLEVAGTDGAAEAVNIPTFVVGSAADPDGVAVALLRALVALCRETDCRRLRIWLPRGDQGAAATFGAASQAVAQDLKHLELELI